MSRDIKIFLGPDFGEKPLKLFQVQSNLRTMAQSYLKNIALSFRLTLFSSQFSKGNLVKQKLKPHGMKVKALITKERNLLEKNSCKIG